MGVFVWIGGGIGCRSVIRSKTYVCLTAGHIALLSSTDRNFGQPRLEQVGYFRIITERLIY